MDKVNNVVYVVMMGWDNEGLHEIDSKAFKDKNKAYEYAKELEKDIGDVGDMIEVIEYEVE